MTNKKEPGIDMIPRILTPKELPISSETSARHLIDQESISSSARSSPPLKAKEIPMEEVRRQNEVERWRNKIRLQDKYQVEYRFIFFAITDQEFFFVLNLI